MTIETPSLERLIQSFLVCGMTEGKSPKTTSWYKFNLTRFCRYLADHELLRPVSEIGPAEARQFVFHLQTEVLRWEDSLFVHDTKRLSPCSVHGYVASIKAFWSWLAAEGYIDRNPMRPLHPPKTPRTVIATFSPEQVQKMLGSLDRKTSRGLRDYAMVLLMLDKGIRLSEFTSLQLEAVDFAESVFTVRGKGNKERVVPFGRQVRRVLWRYATTCRPTPDSPHTKGFFLSQRGLPLEKRAVERRITDLGRQCGIANVRCSPHTFRHNFAKQYLMNGGDIFSLQRILGHNSLEAVKIYLNLVSGDVQQQHQRFVQ